MRIIDSDVISKLSMKSDYVDLVQDKSAFIAKVAVAVDTLHCTDKGRGKGGRGKERK